MFKYKGYTINVKKDDSANEAYRYVAYIIDSSGEREHTRGCSKDDAVSHLKQRIDNYKVYNDIYTAPLSEEELKTLVQYIKNNSFKIARRLKTQHYILPNEFSKISFRAICNHCGIIEDTLKECGEDVSIDVAKIVNKESDIIEKVALYSLIYYNNQSKLQELENILYRF